MKNIYRTKYFKVVGGLGLAYWQKDYGGVSEVIDGFYHVLLIGPFLIEFGWISFKSNEER